MIKYPEIKKYCERVLYPTKTCGVSAGKKYQIDKKIFFQLTNVLNQITNFTSFLLKNIFLKKISIWYFFPALTPFDVDLSWYMYGEIFVFGSVLWAAFMSAVLKIC